MDVHLKLQDLSDSWITTAAPMEPFSLSKDRHAKCVACSDVSCWLPANSSRPWGSAVLGSRLRGSPDAAELRHTFTLIVYDCQTSTESVLAEAVFKDVRRPRHRVLSMAL